MANIQQGIPFLDLVTSHTKLEEELVAAFREALHTSGFVGGAAVSGFENQFAQFCDSKQSVAVNSGTDALRFALAAVGVKPGEVVITVPNTFIATTEAISQVGALPEFVDVDEPTYTMSPERLREYLDQGCTKDTAGRPVSKRSGKPVSTILPVHLYGQMADMDPIMELAKRYHLVVVEDACQAHGAEYFSKRENRWRKAGSMGKASAFSFYPGKNLGALGEGGAITTDNDAIAKFCRMMRDHGQSQKYHHDIEGYNGRLDSIQCAFLAVKLKHLAEWNEQRRAVAARYGEMFRGQSGMVLPYVPSYSRPVWHLYVVRVQDREEVQKCLAGLGIGTGIHYPIPLHQQKAYAHLGYKKGDFPVTDKIAPEILSLPMFPTLAAEQQTRVVEGLGALASASASR